MTITRYRRRADGADGAGIVVGDRPSSSPAGRTKRRRKMTRHRVERALLTAAFVNSLLAVLIISRYLHDHVSNNGPLRPLRHKEATIQNVRLRRRLDALNQHKSEMSPRPSMICALPKSRVVMGSTVVVVDMNFSSTCENNSDKIKPLHHDDEVEEYYTEANGYYKIDGQQASSDFSGLEGSDELCQPAHKWMTTRYPNCNSFHDAVDDEAMLSFLSYGSQTEVFTARQSNSYENNGNDRWVLKKNRYYLELDEHQMELRRKEAVVLERLTPSQYAPSIYGHCGMSLLAPYANGGTIYDLIKSIRNGGPDLYNKSMDILRISVQTAEGLAALHSIDGVDIPSFSHNDLCPDQFVYNKEKMIYQINDFNFGRMILTNKETGESCKVTHSGMRMYKSRAPEDMAVSYFGSGIAFDLAKADVFTLGIALYMILTQKWIWEGEAKEVSIERLIKGERPTIPEDILESGDQALLAVVEAINSSWQHDPEQRSTAKEVAQLLMQRLVHLTARGSLTGDTVVKVQPPPLLGEIMDMDDDYDVNM